MDTADKDEHRNAIVETARAMLAGRITFIEGARRISTLRFKADLEWDPDVLPFVAIDSETDALPVGDVQSHWNSEALAKLQPEVASAETWARDMGWPHCGALVRRFSG
jgi:hypothetical protein